MTIIIVEERSNEKSDTWQMQPNYKHPSQAFIPSFDNIPNVSTIQRQRQPTIRIKYSSPQKAFIPKQQNEIQQLKQRLNQLEQSFRRSLQREQQLKKFILIQTNELKKMALRREQQANELKKMALRRGQQANELKKMALRWDSLCKKMIH